jgi:uncharacterized membrane protein YeaQ/YmgE (transglycosylase-associated protein family)
MELILWLLFGGLVGWVASLVMKTNDQQGIVANIIIGIAGAFLGGVIAKALGFGDVSGFTIANFLVALGGAVLLLFIIRSLTRIF